MRKPNLLEEEGRERGNKWVVYCVIIVGVLIGAGIFVGLICFADVDTYLDNTKQIYRLYDFYDLNVGDSQTAVYFVGSSIIGYALHCNEIDEYLSNQGYNILTYNLLLDSDSPIERSVQLPNIINSSPSLVVYGISYRDATDNGGWNSENIILVHDRLILDNDSLYLYSQSQSSDLTNSPDIFYKKIFLKNAYSNYDINYVRDAYQYTKNPFKINYSNKKIWSTEKIVDAANNQYYSWRPVLTNESTHNKEALKYIVNKLTDSGIPVVILNMPLHPQLSEKITDNTRQVMYDWLNETGAVWYDLERHYNESYFLDTHHATYDGGSLFSKEMADLIIQEVNNGVIHNS